MQLAGLITPTGLLVLTAGAFAVSVAVTRLAIELAHRYALHAVPDHRSSHSVPTPRIGGVGIAGPPLLLLIALWLGWVHVDDGPDRFYGFFLLGAVLYFATGFIDDLHALNPKAKMGLQVVATALAWPVYAAVFITSAQLLSGYPWAGESLLVYCNTFALVLLWVVWVIGFVNAYNFMDGMNGKAGGFAVVVILAFLGIVEWAPDAPAGRDLGLFWKPAAMGVENFRLIAWGTVGAIGGFLVFNCREKASIFLGDSGSHLVGFIIAALAYFGSTSLLGSGRSLLAFTIVLMPFLYDVTITLIRRGRAGKKVWEAHREHLYQRLMVAGFSHMRVLAICMVTYLACGALGMACALAPSGFLRALVLLVSVGVMGLYHVYTLRVEQRAAAAVAA